MQVREIMSRPALSCRSNDNMNNAARLMWERDCGVIAVTDDDGNREKRGIVPERAGEVRHHPSEGTSE